MPTVKSMVVPDTVPWLALMVDIVVANWSAGNGT